MSVSPGETQVQREELSEATVSPSSPETPSGPSMPEPQTSQGQSYQDISETNLKDCEESYIQFGDFEIENIPPGLLEESYGDADLDGVIYHGDLTKSALEAEEYNSNTLESYKNLNEIGEALDTEVYIVPGNNDPDSTELPSGVDRDQFESEGRPSEDDLEKFAEYLEEESDIQASGNPHEDLVDHFDYLEDARSSNVGDELDLIFMGNHFDPELDEEAYKAIFEGPGVEEFYDEEELDEVASYLEDERSYSFGALEKIPLFGRICQALGTEHVDTDEISLENIPDQFKVEKHQNYEEAISEIRDEYEEDIEAFENSLDNLSERVESAENPAIVNHSVPWSQENPHGSMVLREAVKEYGNELEFVSGGHMHSPGVEQMNDVDIVNSAGKITEIGVGEDIDYHVNENLTSPSVQQEAQLESEMDPEQQLEQIEAQIQHIDNLDQTPQELDQEEVEEYRQQLEQKKEEIENKL